MVVFALGLALCSCGSDSLSPATREQIRKAHNRMLTVDGGIAASRIEELFSRMPECGLDAAFVIVAVPEGDAGPNSREAAREAAMRGIDRVKRLVESRPDLVSLALSPEDAYRLEKAGRHAVFIGLGDGASMGADLSMIGEYYDRGVRCLRLAEAANDVLYGPALGAEGAEDRGLSGVGRRIVAECNRLGMIIDAAGCFEMTLADVLAASRAPVIVSGGAARSLCDRPGNLSDGTIRAVGEAGGVILVSFEPERLVAGASPSRAAVGDIADHIEHLIRIAGIRNVGIASGFGRGGSVAGCRDPGGILNLTMELMRRGLSENHIEAVWGGNLMRVFREVEDAAAER